MEQLVSTVYMREAGDRFELVRNSARYFKMLTAHANCPLQTPPRRKLGRDTLAGHSSMLAPATFGSPCCCYASHRGYQQGFMLAGMTTPYDDLDCKDFVVRKGYAG
jgi:hypothetical protein